MSGGTATRHAACFECRQRKVRCDGRQPCCNNCSRRGSRCVYVRSIGQDKQEMMATINSLCRRLSQAEESLRILQDPVTIPMNNPLNYSPSDSGVGGSIHEPVPFDDTWAFLIDTTWAGPQSQSLDHSVDDVFGLGSQASGQQSSPPSVRETEMTRSAEEANEDGILSLNGLNELYATYFENEYTGSVFVEKDRFLSRIANSPINHETQSLKLIILAHGASLSTSQAHLARKFYGFSRKEFENAELGKGFLTLTALQCCVLLAQFELKEALFSRAWANISRANWMLQMFGLDKMDGNSTFQKPHHERRHRLPQTTDAWEVEERRRTFWAAFEISCFITTFLPADDAPGSLPRLNFCDAFKLSGSREISINNALLLISGLHGRCLSHINHATDRGEPGIPAYDFWMHHYRISDCIRGISTGVTPTTSTLSPNEPGVLCVNGSVRAMEICLNYAETVRVTRARSPNPLCRNTALEIASMSRILVGHDDLAKMNNLVLWSIYVAAQACIRTLNSNIIVQHSPKGPYNVSTSRQFDIWAWATGNNEGSSAMDIHQSMGATEGRSILNDVTGSLSESSLAKSGIDAVAFPENSGTVSRSAMQEALTSLIDAVVASKQISPLAGVFEAELRHELSGGKVLTDQRLIGCVEFPLGG